MNSIYKAENATYIASKHVGAFGDARGYEEQLFLGDNGKYFLYGAGGPESPYPEAKTKTITADKAKTWASDSKTKGYEDAEIRLVKEYPSGASYEGEFEFVSKGRKGKILEPCGNGKLTFKGSVIFDGQIDSVKCDAKTGDVFVTGKGVMNYADGSVYDGEVKDNEAHGKGKRVLKDVYVYTGEFKNGKPDGKGREEWSDGTYNTGLFRDGVFIEGDTRVVCNDSEGLTYEGSIIVKPEVIFKEGKMSLANGDYLEGKWVDGKFHEGKKRVNHSDGRVFEGRVKSGKMPEYTEKIPCGDGTFSSVMVCNGKRNGWLKVVKEDGSAISELWKDGEVTRVKRSDETGEFDYTIDVGYCEIDNKDGFKYSGGYGEFGYESNGKMELQNGTVYCGRFIKNKANGFGELTFADGSFCTGEFRNDKFRQGRVTLPDGRVFEVKNQRVSVYSTKLNLIYGCENAVEVKSPILKEILEFLETINRGYFDYRVFNAACDKAREITEQVTAENAKLKAGEPRKVCESCIPEVQALFDMSDEAYAAHELSLSKADNYAILTYYELVHNHSIQKARPDWHDCILKNSEFFRDYFNSLTRVSGAFRPETDYFDLIPVRNGVKPKVKTMKKFIEREILRESGDCVDEADSYGDEDYVDGL